MFLLPPSSTPCKHENTLRFFNAFRVAERGRIGNIWVNWSQVSQLFLMYLLSKLVEHKSYGNVFVQLYISSDSNILEEAHYLDSPLFNIINTDLQFWGPIKLMVKNKRKRKAIRKHKQIQKITNNSFYWKVEISISLLAFMF